MNINLRVFSALIFLTFPILAHAETGKCENFNTHEFFQPENSDSFRLMDEDLFWHCLEVKNGSLIWRRDESGSIPLFKAIAGEIDPTYIDEFFFPIDDWDKLLNLKDKQGRNAMTVALQDAPYWEQMLRLISFGGDIFQKQTDSSPEFIDVAAKVEGNEEFVALLLALGAVSFLEEYDLTGPNNINMKALIFREDWSRYVKSESFDACEYIDQKEVLEALSAGQMKFCLRKFDGKDREFDISHIDRQGNSLLHLVSKYGTDADLVDAVFGSATEEQKEIFLQQTNEDGYNALHIAAQRSQDPNIITRLLAWGFETESKSGSWNPLKKDLITQPLHLAASRTDRWAGPAMLRLLAGEADAFAQDKNGNTALHILMKDENAWIPDIGLILEVQKWQMSLFRSKIPEIKNLDNETALSLAALNRDEYLLFDELLAYGADPDNVDKEGWTPLLIYSQRGSDPDIFASLLEFSENACDTKVSKGRAKGATPLMLVKNNKTLYESDNWEGKSPVALWKQKCPN